MKRVLLFILVIFVLSCKKDEKPVIYEIYGPDEILLKVGDEKDIQYGITPNDQRVKSIYLPTTENYSIAYFDVTKDKIKGLKEGETTLTIKGEVGDQKLVKVIRVIVSPADVESLSFEKDEVSIEVGEGMQLKANILPEKANYRKITWSSSDKNIATVENGLVKTKNEGECNIIASVGGKEATCKVTVKPISVKSITIEYSKVFDIYKKTVSILVEKSKFLSASVLPENAKNKNVKWYSTNPDIIGVSNTGKITAYKIGTSKVICTSENGSVADTVTVNSKDISELIEASGGMYDDEYDGSYISGVMYSSIRNESPVTINILRLTIVNTRNNLVYKSVPYREVTLNSGYYFKGEFRIKREYNPNFIFIWTLSYNGKQFKVRMKSNPSFH